MTVIRAVVPKVATWRLPAEPDPVQVIRVAGEVERHIARRDLDAGRIHGGEVGGECVGPRAVERLTARHRGYVRRGRRRERGEGPEDPNDGDERPGCCGP
jgi:hypothetical protein